MSKAPLERLYTRERATVNENILSSDDYIYLIENLTYKPKYTRKQMSRYEELVKLLPASDKIYYDLHIVEGKKNIEIANKLGVSEQVVGDRLKRITKKAQILGALPLENMIHMKKVLKNILSKRQRVVWESYIGCFNYDVVSEEIGMHQYTVRNTIKHIKTAIDLSGNPKVRKIVVGLIKHQKALSYKRKNTIEPIIEKPIVELTREQIAINEFKADQFTTKEYFELIGTISKATASKDIKGYLDAEKLIKIGEKKNTKYQFIG